MDWWSDLFHILSIYDIFIYELCIFYMYLFIYLFIHFIFLFIYLGLLVCWLDGWWDCWMNSVLLVEREVTMLKPLNI